MIHPADPLIPPASRRPFAYDSVLISSLSHSITRHAVQLSPSVDLRIGLDVNGGSAATDLYTAGVRAPPLVVRASWYFPSPDIDTDPHEPVDKLVISVQVIPKLLETHTLPLFNTPRLIYLPEEDIAAPYHALVGAEITDIHEAP
jgi:hypothetical protein